MHGTKGLSTEINTIFLYITSCWGIFLKRIIIYLCCTKNNEMKAFHEMYKSMFRIQNHTKVLVKYYGLNLEAIGNVF